MNSKNLLTALGFRPKENAVDVYFKQYQQANHYCIEIDFEKQTIHYGDKIKIEHESCLNVDDSHKEKKENYVTLECVNRLLEKGYQPENIILEKTYPTGHNTSGRPDILVTHENGTAYLMIECKTYGKKFDEEFNNIIKDGGQLFTYFQQDTKTELLMLYASKLDGNSIISDSKIIKIEEEFRSAGNVEEVHKIWNGNYSDIKFWENLPYHFENKIFTKKQLIELTDKDGEGLFNAFAEKLRKHSVSDKPNAFNVIFNLFLAKLQDEQKKDDDELEFQWKENDDPVDFQVRLHNLHKDGLSAFLKKEIAGIYDKDFEGKTGNALREAKKRLLMFNRFFTIKDVFDCDTFQQNHRVLKEVVQLIEKYQIRYPKKQKYLSEFFERLLTIGLKQEVGQYFTPPPITKFITRALPLPFLIEKELDSTNPELPAAIDYAAGSGHFLTEIMEEYQDIIEKIDTSKYNDIAQKKVAAWKINQYDWASSHIYGIEKDYRLVKVAKVGCYFYGDGLAQVVHGDGLDSFEKSKSYRGLLKDNAVKPQFSIIVSNPPYAVNDCKDDIEYLYEQYGEKPNHFEIYKSLTYNSKEIECLFVERTKQLLKDDGVAGIILPSSILSNTGIYTKAREIILLYFDIIAITELGSNTFMATGTNTVVLFLRKRNEKRVNEIKKLSYEIAENFSKTNEDKSIDGIDKPVKKYMEHTGEKEINPEKFYYFVLNYWQKTVIVKTGVKEEEKRFLGYEYSNRRGHEGMHAIQRGKSIDECTKLYNEKDIKDQTKASSYIYKAFNKEYPDIHESLKNNIFSIQLVDMLVFDREKFDKTISTTVKKKIKIESKWESVKIGQIATTQYGFTDKASDNGEIRYLRITDLNDDGSINLNNETKFINPNEETKNHFLLKNNDIVIARSGSVGKSAIFKKDKYEDMIFASYLIRLQVDKNKILPDYLFYFTKTPMYWNQVEESSIAVTQPNLNAEKIKEFQIPLPPKEIQQKIVSEMEVLEKKEAEAQEKIEKLRNSISDLFGVFENTKEEKLENISLLLKRGKSAQYGNSTTQIIKSGQARGIKEFDFSQKHFVDKNFILDERKLEKGDILINSTGVGTAGRVTMFDLDGTFVVDSHITILRPNKEKVLPDFVLQSLVKIGFKNIEAMALGSSGQIELSLTTIQNIKIPLPSLPEQQQIVSEIEKIETQIAELEQQLKEIPLEKERVLKKYL